MSIKMAIIIDATVKCHIDFYLIGILLNNCSMIEFFILKFAEKFLYIQKKLISVPHKILVSPLMKRFNYRLIGFPLCFCSLRRDAAILETDTFTGF